MTAYRQKFPSNLAIISFLALTAAGCGKDNGSASSTPTTQTFAESGSTPAAEQAVSAIRRRLAELGARLAAVRTRTTASAVRAVGLRATCDQGNSASEDLSNALQEVTNYANRLSSLDQRRNAEIEGDVLASEGRAASAVELLRQRMTQRDLDLSTARENLADADRNLILASTIELTAARERRDAAEAAVQEAQRNLEADRSSMSQAESTLNTIAGRREESARNLLADATAIDSELHVTEGKVRAAEVAMESCGS